MSSSSADRRVRLGVIADDFTGATDVAGALADAGARTLQILGPRRAEDVRGLAVGYDAVVLACKTRALPADEAVRQSLFALRRLQALGADRIYFKYGSTFDSTAAGNIGPVTAALLQALGSSFAVAVPAYPTNGRTQYFGHLFVGGVPLHESPMRHHPLNPMTDANLVRHLQQQTSLRVGLLPWPVVDAGPEAVAAAVARLREEGVAIALADALSDRDLARLAVATADLPLVTGGSALAGQIARGFGLRAGSWARREDARDVPTLALAGSCSARTLEQVAAAEATGWPVVRVDVRALLAGTAAAEAARLVKAALAALSSAPSVLITSGANADARAAQMGGVSATDASAVGDRIEQTLAVVAKRVLAARACNLVVAGGETSGAVMEALALDVLEVGRSVDPGVPVCRALDRSGRLVVLKSGNFGAVDFFAKCACTFAEDGAG